MRGFEREEEKASRSVVVTVSKYQVVNLPKTAIAQMIDQPWPVGVRWRDGPAVP